MDKYEIRVIGAKPPGRRKELRDGVPARRDG